MKSILARPNLAPAARLITAAAINRFGDSIDTLAISWLMYRETGNPVLMGLLFAASFVPNLLFSPYAGVFVDRHRRVAISVVCDLLRGASTLLLGLCAMLGWLPVWLPFAVILFNATCETFASPAKASIAPLVAGEDGLVRFQGMNASASSFSELAGTACAGVMLAAFGMQGAFVVDSATFFLSAALTATLRRLETDPAPQAEGGTPPAMRMFLDGLQMLGKDKRLLVISLIAAMTNFLLTPFNVLLPVFADRVSPLGANALSLFGVSITVGIGIGGLTVARFHQRLSIGRTVAGSLMAIGGGYGLAAAIGQVMEKGIPATLLVCVALMLLGFSVPFLSAPVQGYAMRTIPPEARGRYFSLLGMISLIGTPLGGLLSGIAARSVPPETLFLIVAACVVLLGFAYLAWDRSLPDEPKNRTLGENRPAEET